MATLNTRSFSALVQAQAAAIQARAGVLVDFTVGSILRAVVEANSGVVLWLQGLILQLLAYARAATSSGADLDSWVNDFGLTRLGATPAVGTVTFSRFTSTTQAVVPVGTKVQTADGSQTFIVVVDVANPHYSPTLNGYVIPPAVSSVDATVNAVIPSAASNVLAGTVSVMVSAVSGVDLATNANAFAGGQDAESDAALRARFVAYLKALFKATKQAIAYAVTTVQAGVQCTITENYNYDGSYNPGSFYVVADDGSGNLPAALNAQIYAAVDAVRGFGISFGVFGPVVVSADVSLLVTVKPYYDGATVRGAVGTAVTAFINGLGLGGALYYAALIQAAMEAHPGVANVSSVTINGGTADIAGSPKATVRAGVIAVS